MASDLSSDLEVFAYAVSHDLRAPVHFIRGHAEAVLHDEGPRLTHTGRDHMQRIVRTTDRLDRIMRDLLAYSRLSTEPLEAVPVELDHVMLDVVDHHSAEIERTAARLTVMPGLPVLAGHPVAFFLALSNLVGNALKFTAPGRPPEVAVWAQRSPSLVTVTVEDNGIGIAPRDHERIFRLFERLHSESEYPGTGMGLALVRRAAERLGGRVRVDSQLGDGARFRIEFPTEG